MRDGYGKSKIARSRHTVMLVEGVADDCGAMIVDREIHERMSTTDK